MTSTDVIGFLPAEGSIEIIGEGPIAQDLRAQLSDRPGPNAGERPAVVVETSGGEIALVAALKRVDDLGTIVLAGPLPNRPLVLDLYADLHLRGITVVGTSAIAVAEPRLERPGRPKRVGGSQWPRGRADVPES